MALFELGCPSLDYVYKMSWAEFRIRLYAYKRKDLNEWLKVREVAYAALVGSHYKPPKSKNAYMPLDKKKKIEETQQMRDVIKMVTDRYHKELKDKNG